MKNTLSSYYNWGHERKENEIKDTRTEEEQGFLLTLDKPFSLSLYEQFSAFQNNFLIFLYLE